MSENMPTIGRREAPASHGRVILLCQNPGGTMGFCAACGDPGGGDEEPGASI